MIKEFIKYEKEIKNLSDNTIMAYEKDLHAFAAYVKATGMADRWSGIHKRGIEAYLSDLHRWGKKPATIRRKLSAIRCFYNWARKQEMTDHNPAQYAESPRMRKNLPNTIEPGAIISYVEDAKHPLALRTLICLLFETGLRISEACSIETWDINWRQHTIRVYGKGLKQRQVIYGSRTEALLNEYLNGRKGVVFQGADACQRQIRYQIWRALREYATDGKASPHTIRHTFATVMLQHGMSLPTLQTLLGHENVETTRNYARIENEQTRAEYQRAMSHV